MQKDLKASERVDEKEFEVRCAGDLCLIADSVATDLFSAKSSVDSFEVRSQPSECSSSSSGESIQKFFEDDEVLAQSTDGLFRPATILRVDGYERCLIKLQDGSECWMHIEQLQIAQMQGTEILCAICDNGESEPPNEIVLCDHCGLGYHQKCHDPEIGEEVLQPEVMWNCHNCVYATTAKKGSVSKAKANAEAIATMQNSLPYDMNALSWDSNHKTNKQQCYCYCGGPGEWYVKMIQCCRCLQWFHEACIECLEMPMLYGDGFYMFVCSVCNCGGAEHIQRLDLDWVDVAHLVLFNLTILHNQMYHELQSTIIPFVNGNWELLQMPKQYQKCTTAQRHKYLLQSLQKNQIRFKCGREMKKKTSLWSLRIREPPPVSNVEYTRSSTRSVSDMDTKKKSKCVVNHRSRSTASDSSSGRVSSSPDTQPVRSLRTNVRSVQSADDAPNKHKQINNSTSLVHHSSISPIKRKRGRPFGSKNKVKKNSISPAKQTKCVYSLTKNNGVRNLAFSDSTDDDNSSRGTLDSIIPPPNNFNGSNNPFSMYSPQSLQKVSIFNGMRSVKRKLNCNDLCIKNGVVRLKRRYKSKMRQVTPASGSDATRSETSYETSPSDQYSKHNTANKGLVSEGVQTTNMSYDDLRSSVNSYFGASNRIANGEKNFTILAKRVSTDGKIQYLIQWDSTSTIA